jgi:hypothetical protein
MATKPIGEFIDSFGVNSDDAGSTKPDNPTEESTERVSEFEVINGTETDAIDPFNVEHVAGEQRETETKRRGRPPGSRNANRTGDDKPSSESGGRGPGRPKANKDLANIEKVLISLHMMGAAALDLKELEIDEKQAKELGDAIRDVQKHYPMDINPKTLAWLNLAAVAGFIYIPAAMKIARRQPREKQERTAPAKVVNIRPEEPAEPQPKAKTWNELTPSELNNAPPTDFTSF